MTRPAHAARPASRDDEYVPRGEERLRRKARGQYITPPALAAELAIWTEVDLAAAGVSIPRGPVLDPACGDGVFLELARAHGWGGGGLWGRDIDEAVLAGPPGADLKVEDGLLDDGDRFAMVLGNPPYGRRSGPEALSSDPIALRYAGWRADRQGRPKDGAAPPNRDVLGRVPLARLFPERFVRAAAPGGVVAMLLPESVFSSSRDQPLRAFLLRMARCVSVTSVQGHRFLRTGTRARTCWSVWVRRPRPLERASDACTIDPPVRLRQPRGEEDHELAAVPGSRPFVAEVPVATLLAARRWDPRRFDPAWDDPLRGCALPIEPLSGFVADIVYGALGRGVRPRAHSGPGGFLYVGQKTLTERGVVPSRCPRIAPERPFVQDRYVLRPGDLVVPRSGMGTLGKNLMTRWDGIPAGCDADGAVVDCFDDRVSLVGISSAWVLAVLRTEHGWWQIRRAIAGVAQPNLSFAQVRALAVPVPPKAIQEEAERRWAAVRDDGEPFEVLRQLVREACGAA